MENQKKICVAICFGSSNHFTGLYIDHDPVMTLTKFMARSAWVAHSFEWGKLLKCHLKGKASRKLANGQNIDHSEKKGLHLPLHWS